MIEFLMDWAPVIRLAAVGVGLIGLGLLVWGAADLMVGDPRR